MGPCATAQKFVKLRRLSGGILVSEQLAHLMFHLRHGFFGLIGQNQCLVVDLSDRFLSGNFDDRSGGILA